MFSKFAICVLIYFGFECIDAQFDFTAIREAAWPYDIATPFPYRTLVPIDVDTSTARIVKPLSALRITIGAAEVNVTNVGYTVLISGTPASFIIGGPLGDARYVFEQLIFFFSGTYTENCYGSIDGEGAPLAAAVAFRNQAYPSLEAALSHRDGLVIVYVFIKVEGYIGNAAFVPFGKSLGSITKFGSSVTASSLSVFSWFNIIPAVQNYYTFPGAFIDLRNGITQYDCATIIILPKGCQPSISIPQFQYFLDLLNGAGTPIVTTASTRPAGRRPIVEMCGTAEFILPTAFSG